MSVNSIQRAVILAGGLGTRLRPYTVALPKPLMPIGQYPILEVIVRQLAHHGVERITLAVNHQADLMRAYFGDGSKWGIIIDYSLESTALGTMGPLTLIDDLPENILVMNGDVLTDLNFLAFFREHLDGGQAFTISASKREQKIDYGVLQTGNDGYLESFIEKPTNFYLVSMGIYAINREAFSKIPEGKPFGFDNLMLDLLKAEIPVKTLIHAGYWLDIGRPDDYQKAVEDWPTISEALGVKF